MDDHFSKDIQIERSKMYYNMINDKYIDKNTRIVRCLSIIADLAYGIRSKTNDLEKREKVREILNIDIDYLNVDNNEESKLYEVIKHLYLMLFCIEEGINNDKVMAELWNLIDTNSKIKMKNYIYGTTKY